MSDLVTVATFMTPVEAEAVKALLESEGIRAFVDNEAVAQFNVLLSNAVGWVKVQTADADAEKARQVLVARGLYTHHAEAETTDDSLTCLACGAAMPEGQEKCAACGWTYEDEER